MRTPLLALAVLLLAGSARAQALRDFCAERPGKATPPCILDAGRLQLEVGLADAVFQRGAGAHEDIYALGAAEVRFGLTRRVEVEAGWTPLIVDRARGAGRRTGVGDAMLGARAALTDPDRGGPAVSVQGFVTAPAATHGLGAGGWTGGLRLPASIPLGSDAALGLTPEVDVLRDAAGGGTHLAWLGAAGVSHAFGPTTLGAELWGEIDGEPSGEVRSASADFTAAYAVGKNAQLDAGVNLGLNHATADVEVYAGIARRF
jgi:hypothetical protein